LEQTIAGSGRAMSLCCMKTAGHTGVEGFRDAVPECAEVGRSGGMCCACIGYPSGQTEAN
jgi:hypothetical protein